MSIISGRKNVRVGPLNTKLQYSKVNVAKPGKEVLYV